MTELYFTAGGFLAGFIVCWIYKTWIYNKIKAEYEMLKGQLPK